jgi:V/A-type H+-transporting ATPase subunit I
MGAIFDAGLWLLTLPGFLLIASTLFLETPPWALRLGLALFGVGALGLVLTQGRHERGIAGKCITGFVSLYGILGSYGCVSFMGDVLSYSRLLALGLTTSVVGMAFNMMAGMLRQVHAAGPVLFVAMLLFGHAFNFAISILGSFIHPARLIFLEFFGRFYEGGAVRFRPLSPDSDQVMVVSS